MKTFGGFPRKMEFTPVPNLFLSAILPEIDNIAELKTTLYAMALLYRKKGYPQYVTYRELLQDPALVSSLKGLPEPEEALAEALKAAAERGTLLHITLDNGGVAEDIYLLNTEPNRQAVARIESGEIKLAGLEVAKSTFVAPEAQPDIFALYEQNIGMLTPMIADELRDAEKHYPEAWLRDAIKEAVNQNKRKWNYIAAILERWAAEGRSDGAYQRDSKADPDKYIKGKYGHMVQR